MHLSHAEMAVAAIWFDFRDQCALSLHANPLLNLDAFARLHYLTCLCTRPMDMYKSASKLAKMSGRHWPSSQMPKTTTLDTLISLSYNACINSLSLENPSHSNRIQQLPVLPYRCQSVGNHHPTSSDCGNAYPRERLVATTVQPGDWRPRPWERTLTCLDGRSIRTAVTSQVPLMRQRSADERDVNLQPPRFAKHQEEAGGNNRRR
jgi:hypothetical protein